MILVGFAGFWLARSTAPDATPPKREVAEKQQGKPVIHEEAPRFNRGERPRPLDTDREAFDAGALEGQRVLVFKDQAALRDFLERAGGRVRVMGRLDALNALRIGFLKYDDLAALLDGTEEASFIFPVDVPSPTEGTVQAGAVALGNKLLSWLGITGDNSTAGNGVRIAILDTGVSSHSSFSSKIFSINLVELGADLANWNGHGTGVASIIIGNDPNTPGVAPGAEIVSIRVANDNGESDSFKLAQGIIAAVDAGAVLINISLGGRGDSAIVRLANAYATNAGALIVAAAGNDGTGRISFPAGNTGVISVGAVDAVGNHMAFSNTGQELDFSAPGYGVNVAWTGNQTTQMDGTSPATPVVVGAIAHLMTESGPRRLNPNEALELLLQYTNDAGSAGGDAVYGNGFPALDRIANSKTPGIYDAALAAHVILPPDKTTPYAQLGVLVQNRGTETLVNTGVEITSPSGTIQSNIPSLVPNAVQTIYVPISQENYTSGGSLRFDSRIVPSRGYQDSKPSNNRRVETYTPAAK